MEYTCRKRGEAEVRVWDEAAVEPWERDEVAHAAEHDECGSDGQPPADLAAEEGLRRALRHRPQPRQVQEPVPVPRALPPRRRATTSLSVRRDHSGRRSPGEDGEASRRAERPLERAVEEETVSAKGRVFGGEAAGQLGGERAARRERE